MERKENDFDFDVAQEQYSRNAVKKQFFEPYIETKGVIVESIDELKDQLSGVDFRMTRPNGCQTIIDLKAQMNDYLGRPTVTFCVELSYLKYGVEKIGWFMNDSLVTDQYALMWVNDAALTEMPYTDRYGKTKTRTLVKNVSDFKQYELMFIERQKIKEHIANVGLTKEKIQTVNDLMRSGKIDDRMWAEVFKYCKTPEAKAKAEKETKCLHLYYDTKTHHLTYTRERTDDKLRYISFTKTVSSNKAEEPINLVIRKERWTEAASAYYVIENGVITAKKERGIICNKIVA